MRFCSVLLQVSTVPNTSSSVHLQGTEKDPSNEGLPSCQNNRVKNVDSKMSRLHNASVASVHVLQWQPFYALFAYLQKRFLLCPDLDHDHMDIWASLADNVEKRETHGMYPCNVPLYCMSGKDVTVSPYPSVRGKKAAGLGTSAVNIGGYIFPVPEDDCPAASRPPVSCNNRTCHAPPKVDQTALTVCH